MENSEKPRIINLLSKVKSDGSNLTMKAWCLTGFYRSKRALDTSKVSFGIRDNKELFSSHTGSGDDDVPYDVDTHLTEINTGAIDKDYMQTRFRKFLKALQEGEETSGVLDELHRSFAVLGKEEQKYADMILVDIQSGNLTIEEGKILSDYIVEYQTKAHNDRIHRFSEALGVDEEALREFMSRPVTPENINEYGAFDRLMDKVDRKTARAYFERVEGVPIKPNRVANKIDAILRRFILEGGFDI